MKYSIVLLAPPAFSTDNINFKKQIEKNRTNETAYNAEIVEELTRTRENYRKGLEKGNHQHNKNSNNLGEQQLVTDGLAYLSLLRLLVFNPQDIIETKLEKVKEEVVEEITEEVTDSNGVVSLVKKQVKRSASPSNSKPSSPSNHQPQHIDKYSKLRFSLSFVWKNGTKASATVNDSLYEACMALVTIANQYTKQAQESINRDVRKDAYKHLTNVRART
jgi:uncharacterized protein (DUF608 family)